MNGILGQPATTSAQVRFIRSSRLAATSLFVLPLIPLVLPVDAMRWMTALVVVGVSAAVLVAAMTARGTVRLLVAANLMAVLLLIANAVGVCTSGCGGWSDHAYIGPLPTSWLGIVLHIGLAGLWLSRGRLVRERWRIWPLAMGQGASGYFTGVLLTTAFWCPVCVAVHLVMLGQAVLSLRMIGTPRAAIIHVGLACGMMALLHGVFALLVPARPSSFDHEDASSASIPPSGRVAGDQVQGEPVGRVDFFRWGDAEAPVVMRAHVSLVCPVCQKDWEAILALRPHVQAKRLAIEFILTWPSRPVPHHGSRLASLLFYAAGAQGEEALLRSGARFFAPDASHLIGNLDREWVDAPDQAALAAGETALLLGLADGPVGDGMRRRWRQMTADVERYLSVRRRWIEDERSGRDTPRFFYLRRGQEQAFAVTTSLHPRVVEAFIQRGMHTAGGDHP